MHWPGQGGQGGDGLTLRLMLGQTEWDALAWSGVQLSSGGTRRVSPLDRCARPSVGSYSFPPQHPPQTSPPAAFRAPDDAAVAKELAAVHATMKQERQAQARLFKGRLPAAPAATTAAADAASVAPHAGDAKAAIADTVGGDAGVRRRRGGGDGSRGAVCTAGSGASEASGGATGGTAASQSSSLIGGVVAALRWLLLGLPWAALTWLFGGLSTTRVTPVLSHAEGKWE